MKKKRKEPKSAAELRSCVGAFIGIDPQGAAAKGIKIFPVNDTWRAMSGRHDDDADFRNKVVTTSILLAEKYDLEQ